MTRAGTWRTLAPTEQIHAAREAYIGYTVRAEGRLDLAALTTAYAAVCQAYPQLGARLDDGDDGPVFVESDTRPELRTGGGDLDRPLAGVTLDQRRTLSALNVVRDGDVATVCLLTHHSIADANHSVALLAEIWSCYTDVVGGVPVELPRHPYPRSLEELLAERGIRPTVPDRGPAPGPMAMAAPSTDPDRSAFARNGVQHRLTAAQTTALAELGHREHVTINGLLAGVLLLVEADLRDLPLTELVYRFTVNLRGHLTPQVGATEGTNVLGGSGFVATDDIGPDAVTLARAIGERLRAGLADGSIQRSLLDLFSRSAPEAKPWDPGAGPVAVGMMNWGLVPPMRTPDELRLTNFHAVSSIREFSTLGGYVVNTFDGRIGIDMLWPEGDADLPKRLDHLREQLSRLKLPR
ncbi:phthiocerol/phthiodiolone dimycocerosyl transferase family protein [Micromonospora sp. NBC_00421]|uniref:phthiocerol/phthiodiolone dimycocerosyl transferase family protein n=1 Tax=Micromonospora sp. NBC_00421 TaxID=2975976 RepID=UPI002E1D5F83